MELGLIRKIDIDREMQQAYLDYAMSVIVARALPDARDGLKPVQRRILFAMHDMGLRADSTYKKSARIVGEVLGKYHPHGDTAVYEAMARMAQTFSLRTLLVDGQGNFGSVDGDPPAAMRYTEARLAPPALEMLADLGKDTVDFIGNFDDTLQEPTVLPAALPNLLVNGATGIAVGMATSIPPHNLGEVTEALIYMLERWDKLDEISVEDLMKFVRGPDFPTGGMIIEQAGAEGIEAAYGSGRGRITIQAKAHTEEMERGRRRIIVSELPYQVNKSTLIERIAELARGGSLEGLADLRDESDRQGLRIVIELSKSADADKVLAELYRRTQMETTFSIILLALVDGEPRLLTLKQALRVYLEHRLLVVKRRAEFDLLQAQQRAHILEGYLTALKHLDELITLIRSAADAEAARAKLMKRYKLSEAQAVAILDMQLRRLAALERKKIETEYREVSALIKDLEGLLKSSKRMRLLAAEELQRTATAFADRRRTQIVHIQQGKTRKAEDVQESLPDQPVWIGITAGGRMARTHDDKPPKSSGAEAPRLLVRLNTTDVLYLVSAGGTAAAVSVNNIPEAESLGDGVPFFKASPLREADVLVAAFALPAKRAALPAEAAVLVVTRAGLIKKTLVSELPGPSAQTFTLARINDGDALVSTMMSDGKRDVLLLTALGMAIRFTEGEVRPMGLVAAGVSGIRLDDKDSVIAAEVLPAPGEVLLLASDGRAKRIDPKEFPVQGRYGKGVNAWSLPGKIRLAGAVAVKGSSAVTIHLAKGAPKATRPDAAGVRKRASTRGDKLVDLKPGDSVVGLTTGWMVERYVQFTKVELPRAKKSARTPSTKRAAGGKKKPPTRKGSGKKAKTKDKKPARKRGR